MESEFRQDIVSGDWILIAPLRSKRPDPFKETRQRQKTPKKGCRLEIAGEKGNGKLIFSWPTRKNWRLRVITNKYPVITPKKTKVIASKKGPISIISGIGHHEMVVTRDHDANFPRLNSADDLLVFQAFQSRYQDFSHDKNLFYVSLMHNWGPTAGASIYHPHYQIVAIPLIPPDVAHSLEGSRRYFRAKKKCVHCTQIAWERKQKKRIVFENKGAVAFCPFVSREPFELRIIPKTHIPFFEDTGEELLKDTIEALQVALKKLETSLHDPDYNFFIHTTPIKNRSRYYHYHWHIEVIPRTNISAGFELGTAIEINPLDPDKAAAILRNA
ncbi:MAG: DUF4921 family protein [Candidatus Colwellbacteria bacterium]